MEKILVTTDLSENSLAGMRFAIQLSTQRAAELVFLLVDELWDETVYHDPIHAQTLRREKKRIQEDLESLVNSTCKDMNIEPGKYQCVVYYHYGVVNSIIDYATNHNCSFICISTHGAGNLRKLMGTHTGELIKTSEIPVLCIPRNYAVAPVSRILYASDMSNYQKEMQNVVAFAKSTGAAVDMVNFFRKTVPSQDISGIEQELQQKLNYKITVHVEKMEEGTTLTENLDKAVEKYTPSMLVMFTNQERDFFEMLFLPSQSERYSFRTRVPMLVFNKTPHTPIN